MKRILFYLTALFLVSSTAFAQQSLLAKLKEKYPNSNEITLNNNHTITIDVDETGLVIYDDIYEERMLLKYTGGLKKKTIQYNSFSSIEEIKAYTLAMNKKGKYKKIKVKKFQNKDILDDMIFHDDTKELSFYFPEPAEGAKTVIAYKQHEKNPRFLNSFFVGDFVPTLETKFTIKVNPAVDIAFQYFNLEKKDITLNKTEDKEWITYEWTQSSIPAAPYEASAPNPRYYLKHIIPYIKSFKNKEGETVNLLRDVGDLYAWYADLLEQMPKKDTKQLQAITDSLVQDKTTEMEKVKAVFYWVQNNIKYVAFEEGMGGFIPRNAVDVCEKRYGDCKDMANLTSRMLQMANIPCFHTWIGSDDIPYTYDLPTPAVDNHMIATYIDSLGKHHFLDATGQYYSASLPTHFIQGQEALIGVAKDSFIVSKVPVMPANRTLYEDNLEIQIIDNKVVGIGKAAFTGYKKTALVHRLNGESNQEKKDFFISYLSKGNNTFEIKQLNDKNIQDRDLPYLVNYDFELENYVRQNGDELYINLNLDKPFKKKFIKKDRKLPIQRSYQQGYVFNVNLEIPKGYTVDYLPKDNEGKNKLMNYKSTYTQKEGKIELNLAIESTHLLLSPQDFDTWNKELRKLVETYSEVVVLKKQ
ncbi:MAG: DUF3857 domain-containing protein [Cytophagales bacterium]|nr:DUF3857 domain-containing protein [Cytophagales bacterium]